MAGDVELELGAQRLAASVVRGGISDVKAVLVGVADAVGEQSAGFRGVAADALGVEVSAWLTAAEDVVPALVAYAQALEMVDVTTAATEADNISGLRASAGGFPSGLRMD
ncbi:hypothetical protein KEM60_01161 [Austwickia sp. TVS 96-490-7B]|uniref:hypothetical protein n=1 Tax=Austwickia sp. TVS 96-490-7B TaxID=2830843 RepID=UPI001C57CE2A|nr:hypothetical protein [Austwickia sp. TVS 96-490-7B]MBW3084970.1 hypothetical protein [Austwickia sp. TVS 96-490-7B]